MSPPELPHNRGIAGETSFGIGLQNIFWDCRGRTSCGIASSSSILKTAGTLLLGSLNIIGFGCWDIVSGVAAPSSSRTAGASYRTGSLIVGLPECHLRIRRIIIVGSRERRLSGSVHRTYLALPGENVIGNHCVIIDRLGLLNQASGVTGHLYHVLDCAGTLRLESVNIAVRDWARIVSGVDAPSISGSPGGHMHRLGSHQHFGNICFVVAPHAIFVRGGG